MEMNPKILIVDDERAIVTLLKYNLENANFSTDEAYDGEVALQKLEKNNYDLIILDVMLPKKDGIEVVKTLRQKKDNTPILMLTAINTEFDKVLALEIGADDYLTKPFSPRESIARVKAILRRTKLETARTNSILEIGQLTINSESYVVTKKGQQLSFTKKEFELLLFLVNHQDIVLSREQFLNKVWGFEFGGDTRIVDVHISRLRAKIEENVKNPQYIKTIHGLGYKFEDPFT